MGSYQQQLICRLGISERGEFCVTSITQQMEVYSISNSSKIKRANAEKFSEPLQFHRELIIWHMCHVLKSYFCRGLEAYKSTLLLSPFPTRDIWYRHFFASNLLFHLLSRQVTLLFFTSFSGQDRGEWDPVVPRRERRFV